MTRYQKISIALIVAVIIAFFIIMAVRPMVAPDEFRYGEIPREMLDTGDWIAPHLNGLPYYEKPVLGYWATAISIATFGQNQFAIRLPFAIATLATAAIIFLLVRNHGPGRWPALLAAAIYLTTTQVAIMGTYAILDPMLTLFLTMALATFFIATQHPSNSWNRHRHLMLCGLACGLAFLTKGFLAFAVAAVVAAPYLIYNKRFRDLFTLPITPIIITAIIAAPWSIAVHYADPDFWHYFFYIEHVKRFTGGSDAQHAAPIWFYIPVLLAGALPWTPFIPQIFRRLRYPKHKPLMQWAICWFIFPILFFSTASGKLATYILPCFAPLSIILAISLSSMRPAGLRLHLGRFSKSFAIGLIIISTLMIIHFASNPFAIKPFLAPGETYKGIAAGVILAIAAAVLNYSIRSHKNTTRIASITAAMLVVLIAIATLFPAWLGYKTPGAFLEKHAHAIPDNAIVVSDASVFHAVCWTLGRSDISILGSKGELGYGLARPENQHRLLKNSQLADMINDQNRTQPLVVVGHVNWFDPTSLPTPSYQNTWKNIAIYKYPPPNL